MFSYHLSADRKKYFFRISDLFVGNYASSAIFDLACYYIDVVTVIILINIFFLFRAVFVVLEHNIGKFGDNQFNVTHQLLMPQL